MVKEKIIALLVLSLLVNYGGWLCLVRPVKLAESPDRIELLDRILDDSGNLKKDTIIRSRIPPRRYNVTYLHSLEWFYKIVIFGLAPGGFCFYFWRRGLHRQLPNGKPILTLLGIGLVSDVGTLLWIMPAWPFYVAALGLLLQAKETDYPAAPAVVKRAPRRKIVRSQAPEPAAKNESQPVRSLAPASVDDTKPRRSKPADRL